MLKHIPAILTPDLLKILMEVGHGDEIVIADGNFPAAALAQRLVRLDRRCCVLRAVMQFFPLDAYTKEPVALMEAVPGDPAAPEPERCHFEFVERFAFYERAKRAYAVIATGKTEIYANILLKKGVVLPEGA